MTNLNIADLLVGTGCYVNTTRENKEPIFLPDGSSVPVYLSCRRLFSHPLERAKVAAALSETVRTNFPNADLVAGIATAGIGWAYAIASDLGLPLAYVRNSEKGYGIQKLVDGNPSPNSNAVIVDDVLFSGKSVKHAVESLRSEVNIKTEGVVGIVALNGAGTDAFRGIGCKALTLINHYDLLASALEGGVINSHERDLMNEYYERSGLGNE